VRFAERGDMVSGVRMAILLIDMNYPCGIVQKEGR
jgi:hypothetical protein